jgi:preprotein translocase subunit SecD
MIMEKLTSPTKVLAAASSGLLLSAFFLPDARSAKPPAFKVKVEIRRAETEPADDLTEAVVSGTNQKVYLHKKADVTNEDIADAKMILIEDKYPAIEITFTKAGKKKMAAYSKEQMGKPMAVLVDGVVITAPTVKSKIGDKAWIQGIFTATEAQDIANGIKSK